MLVSLLRRTRLPAMRFGLVLTMLALLLLGSPQARGSFLSTLTPEQAKRLGLDQLTAEKAAAIDAAIEEYTKAHNAVVAQQAAAAAVVEYKARQEPAVVARAVDVLKKKQEEEKVERFTTRILGRFTGWGGGTFFALENGQVWQQSGSEVYYISPVENPEVEFRKAPSGHFRLYLADGTWVTVKRLR
jgi:hypothetical protein